MFFGNGFRLGRIGSITISIDYSWFIIFGLVVFALGGGFFPQVAPEQSPALYWASAVVTALLFFSSVLFHELSHAFIARRAGIPINGITLFLFGGVAQMEDEPGSPWDEFKMAIAGPIASLVAAVIFFGLALAAGALGSRLAFSGLTYLWFINVVLAVFNMLPGFPMDGGRVMRAIIWHFTRSLRKATQIASITGQGFGWLFIGLGVASFFFFQGMGFNGIWYVLIGWFLISAARSSYQQVVMRETLSSVPIAAVMNPQVEAVEPDITVDHLVTEYFLRESPSTLPVEQNGMLLGMVSVEDVRAVPREQWGHTLVREILKPLEEEQVVHPADDAWDAANRMARTNRDRVLVTDNGHVEGIVTRGAIIRWLQTHTQFAPGMA